MFKTEFSEPKRTTTLGGREAQTAEPAKPKFNLKVALIAGSVVVVLLIIVAVLYQGTSSLKPAKDKWEDIPEAEWKAVKDNTNPNKAKLLEEIHKKIIFNAACLKLLAQSKAPHDYDVNANEVRLAIGDGLPRKVRAKFMEGLYIRLYSTFPNETRSDSYVIYRDKGLAPSKVMKIPSITPKSGRKYIAVPVKTFVKDKDLKALKGYFKNLTYYKNELIKLHRDI
jgi:hypothetical protein